jgi:tetratricopeptide (TPR) repeat protein
MRTQKLFVDLLFAIISLCAVSMGFAQSDTQFTKGNQEYAAGHFKEAIENYESLVQSHEWAPNLFYNLGNAYFRENDFGRAILNYERALALDRHHPESAANLQIVHDETRALELAPPWTQRFLHSVDATQYAITASVAFWIGAFSLVVISLSQRRRRAAIVLSILSLSIFAIAVVAAYSSESSATTLAIVIGDNVTARLATADNAGSVLALPAGSEIKILSERGDWVYAELPNNLRGWIPSKSAEQVRL